jgi:excisionase family DNA binding protein
MPYRNHTLGIIENLARIEAKLDGMLNEELMTANEAAAFLDVSIDHIYRLCCKHRIPHYKPMGKRVYFKRSELAE